MNKRLRYRRFPVGGADIQSQKHLWPSWLQYRQYFQKRSVSLGVLVLLCSIGKLSFAAPTDIVATVDGQPILMREVDEWSSASLSKLHDELSILLVRTVNRLIDERLRSLTASETNEEASHLSVTDEEIRSYQTAHKKDKSGASPAEGVENTSPDEQMATLRHYLEQKAREAAERQARQRLRQGHVIRVSLPHPQELEVPMTQERQIAQVDNSWIRAAEFEQAAAWRLYQLRGEIYRERLRNLAPVIENRLLDSEARRRGITTEALLAELSARESVSEEELQAFVAAEQEAGRPIPTTERTQASLEFRKAYDRRQTLLKNLRAEIPVKILLKEPPIPYLPVIDTGEVTLGAKKGKRLIVYTNYRCPACRAAHQEIDTLLIQDKKLRVIFHDFIPGRDPVALEAAYLTRCAAQWGTLPRMRKELLTREVPSFGQHWYKESELPELVRKLRLRRKTEFLECLGTELYTASERDTENIRALGFEEPPAFVAEGLPMSGTPSAERLAQALEQGLKAQLRQKQDTVAENFMPKRRRRRHSLKRKWVNGATLREPCRALRSAKEQGVTAETAPWQRTKPQSLQKSKTPPRSLVTKKTALKLRREKLFDVE